jgi:hypothetical protein
MGVGGNDKQRIPWSAAKIPDVKSEIDFPRYFLSAPVGPGDSGLIAHSLPP